MDAGLYLEVASLFRFRYDPTVLAALESRPSRFREIARTLQAEADPGITDTAVTRSLARLQRAGQIRAVRFAMGSREASAYELTEAGARTLELYRALLETYRAHRPA